jgi:large subunit ribosomal protein L9
MEVILVEDVPSLGKIGEVVRVKDGYARNYLLPRKLCVEANIKSLKALGHQKKVLEEKKHRVERESDLLQSALEARALTITAKAGEEDRLFGSVTNLDIESALKKEGFQISRKDILLETPIKALGDYTVPIKFPGGRTAQVKITVVRE